jgi:DNA-3-methyladenine glycosylase II
MAGIDITDDLQALAARDTDVARELLRIGTPEGRYRPPGFATLLRIILGQQVSVLAASAMWRKLEAALGNEIDARTLIGCDDDVLRACGVSRQKRVYARSLAEALLSGRVDLARVAGLDDASAIAELLQVKGIGVWSAEIYLLFALQRPDAFPAGDLALRIGYQRLKRLGEPPTASALRALSVPWRPYRGAAAHFLWHSYANPPLG